MANFQTHLTASTILGVGYGGAAYGLYGVPPTSCLLAAGFCSLAGMLPDIDSGPGRPLREITTFLAAVIPTMALGHFTRLGLSHEAIILIGAAIYAAIRFGLAEFLRHYTVHRGMFHSFPTAAIFGELAFLLLYGDSWAIRCYVAGGVVLGFLSHLVLDEVYSVQWDGSPRLKKSFGTAMKFFGEGWWPNVTAYAKFIILTFIVIRQPALLERLEAGQTAQVVQDLTRGIPFGRATIAPPSAGANQPPASLPAASIPPAPSQQPQAGAPNDGSAAFPSTNSDPPMVPFDPGASPPR